MLTLLVLFMLFGLASVTHGALALVRNARAVYADASSGKYWALLASLAAGAALAVGITYVSYSVGVGRVDGFPFPVATTNEAVFWPDGHSMQGANMAFAFVLPQLLLRWALRKRDPKVKADAVSSRKWVDLILLVVTGIALAGFIPLISWMPKALERIPSQEGRVLLIWPPMAVLAAWCVASVWIFDSGLTNRGRWVWLLLLMLAIIGFPASCIHSFLHRSDAPLMFRSHIVIPPGPPTRSRADLASLTKH